MQDQVHPFGAKVEAAPVDRDDLLHLLRTGQSARDVDRRTVGTHHPDVDEAAVVGTLAGRAQLGGQAAFGSEGRSVDEGDLLVGDRREQASKRRKLQHANVFGCQLAGHPDRQAFRRLGGQHADEHAEFADQVQPRRDILADRTAGDIDGVGDELTGQCQFDAGRNVGAGPVLGFAGGGAEVRGDHHLRQLEQRAVGARLGGEHVQTRGAHMPARDRIGQRLLVDEPAARGVDDDDARLGLGQGLLAQQPRGLLGLGQVHRDEVGAGQHIVEREQFDTQLGGAGRRHVGVVGDDVGAEGGQPMGHQLADAAEAHHADGLAEDLGAVELGALPGVLAQGRVGGRDLPGCREHQRQRMLGRAVDIGGRRVDHQHPGGRRGVDVDVVQAHTRPGDDLELGCGGDHLGVDGGGGADQDRVGVGDGFQQLGAVGAVDPADLHLVAEGGNGGLGKFVGDQHNRQAHADRLVGGGRAR